MSEADKNFVVIDVREPFEFTMGHIQGAINIPSESLMNGAPEMKEIAKDSKIIVYCRSGSRSGLAIQIFKQMGFENLVNGINQEMVRMNFGLS